jgi:lysophospholipase L1-like esterase
LPQSLLMLALACLAALSSWLFAATCAAPLEHAVIAPDDSHIRYVGRFEPLAKDGVRFGWPASQIEARFTGPLLRVRIAATPGEPASSEVDRLLVQIDDRAARTLRMAPGDHVYPLADDLGAGTHHVRLWKLTEGDVGTLTFRGFQLSPSGTLVPKPESPRLHIEAVGDSVTAGFGALGPATCREQARYQSSYASFTAVAARNLGASYTAIASSGRGVLRNFDSSPQPETLPVIYDRVVPSERTQRSVPDALPADVVVIELGTNDFIAGVPDMLAWSAAYATLIGRVRARHPRALLILVAGPLLD